MKVYNWTDIDDVTPPLNVHMLIRTHRGQIIKATWKPRAASESMKPQYVWVADSGHTVPHGLISAWKYIDGQGPADDKNYMNEVSAAFEILKSAMVFDDPSKSGSYAHSWHCNIAMMCYDAIRDNDSAGISPEDARKIGNDAASRFMKLCFDVDTKA